MTVQKGPEDGEKDEETETQSSEDQQSPEEDRQTPLCTCVSKWTCACSTSDDGQNTVEDEQKKDEEKEQNKNETESRQEKKTPPPEKKSYSAAVTPMSTKTKRKLAKNANSPVSPTSQATPNKMTKANENKSGKEGKEDTLLGPPSPRSPPKGQIHVIAGDSQSNNWSTRSPSTFSKIFGKSAINTSVRGAGVEHIVHFFKTGHYQPAKTEQDKIRKFEKNGGWMLDDNLITPSEERAKRIPTDKTKVTHVTINVGTNDISRAREPDYIGARIDDAVTEATNRFPQAVITVMEIPPRLPWSKDGIYTEKATKRYKLEIDGTMDANIELMKYNQKKWSDKFAKLIQPAEWYGCWDGEESIEKLQTMIVGPHNGVFDSSGLHLKNHINEKILTNYEATLRRPIDAI